VRDGLGRALGMPVGKGYADLTAGIAQDAGMYVRGELGWHPIPDLAAFAFGEASTTAPWDAGVGIRYTFGG
jgi:hypothetical protein